MKSRLVGTKSTVLCCIRLVSSRNEAWFEFEFENLSGFLSYFVFIFVLRWIDFNFHHQTYFDLSGLNHFQVWVLPSSLLWISFQPLISILHSIHQPIHQTSSSITHSGSCQPLTPSTHLHLINLFLITYPLSSSLLMENHIKFSIPTFTLTTIEKTIYSLLLIKVISVLLNSFHLLETNPRVLQAAMVSITLPTLHPPNVIPFVVKLVEIYVGRFVMKEFKIRFINSLYPILITLKSNNLCFKLANRILTVPGGHSSISRKYTLCLFFKSWYPTDLSGFAFAQHTLSLSHFSHAHVLLVTLVISFLLNGSSLVKSWRVNPMTPEVVQVRPRSVSPVSPKRRRRFGRR